MTKTICQSISELSSAKRHNFFEDNFSSEEREILAAIKIKKNISDIFSYNVRYHALKSEDGNGLKALHLELEHFFSPYIQSNETLVTYVKSPIDIINDIITRAYKDTQSCAEDLLITILISNQDLKTYSHRDTSTGENTAKIVIPLLGKSTIFVPYSDVLYKYYSKITPNLFERSPANHGSCFISKGFSSSIHSQPETDEARIIVFFGPADIQNTVQSNDVNFAGVVVEEEL